MHVQKLKGVAVTHLAGYEEISWQGLQPSENLLVGRNGAGKSSLLEAIAVGLNFLQGRRSGDLLTGANQEAVIHFRFADGLEKTMSLGEIRASQTPVGSRPIESVLYVHEARRPKSRFGRGRSRLVQHSTKRYEYVLSELQALLRGSAQDRALAERLLRETGELRHSGHPREWEWARSALPRGGPNAPRPVSCGQYDVLSLVLDVVRTEEVLAKEQLQPFVILDNPEAFLHPALQEEMVRWISRRLPHAQIFIATHSLKLLARAAPPGVFWLSRDLAGKDNRVAVQAVRDLAPDSLGVFFELYGDDTSSAIFHLALGLESSEYLAFLCACALPCRSIARPDPIQDVQIRAVVDELRHFQGPWTLVDVGAGAGDLLVGAEGLGIANPAWEYVAVEENPSIQLINRVTQSRDAGRIASSSRIIAGMEDLPEQCDAVVFANTSHALGLDHLADWLAASLERLRPDSDSRCVIHEVEVLRHGEHNYVMWSPEDYLAVFATIPGVTVTERSYKRQAGVPVHTTLLTRFDDRTLPADLATRLRTAFEALLLPKLQRLLSERESLRVAPEARTLSAALRQRRRAFVSEQCSNIVDILQQRGALHQSMPPPARDLDGRPSSF
jgi:energy-coupling factor transporter ATP-binding protein EcfA2